MDVREFDFDLPPELIAQEPPRERGGSRLLHLDRASGAIQHTHITALPDRLRAGDLVVVNDTRVFPARLLGRRVPSGGAVECLLVARAGSDTCQTGVGLVSAPGPTPVRPPEPPVRPPEPPVRPPEGAWHVPGTCQAPGGEVWEALMHPG